MKMKETIAITGVTMGVLATPAFSQSTTVAGFDGGSNDGFSGNAFFEAKGGNPGGNAHHDAALFFNELRTGAPSEPANAGFLGDYSPFAEVTLSVDVKTESLTNFFGFQIARPIGFKLWNRNIQGPDSDAGVFFEAGTLGVDFTPDWTTLSVTFDPTSSDLPPGWIGFGDVNEFFEPVLPAGVTFADILADVTEFDVTGAVPGFLFTDAFFDVRVDNIAVILPEDDCSSFTCGQNNDKVLLCHAPPGDPGNAHTICISPAALPAHLAEHPDDHCGPCEVAQNEGDLGNIPSVQVDVISNLPGVLVNIGPPDTFGDDGGVVAFERFYRPGSVITLNAPNVFNGRAFLGWNVDGIGFGGWYTGTSLVLPVIDGYKIEAVYSTLRPARW